MTNLKTAMETHPPSLDLPQIFSLILYLSFVNLLVNQYWVNLPQVIWSFGYLTPLHAVDASRECTWWHEHYPNVLTLGCTHNQLVFPGDCSFLPQNLTHSSPGFTHQVYFRVIHTHNHNLIVVWLFTTREVVLLKKFCWDKMPKCLVLFFTNIRHRLDQN